MTDAERVKMLRDAAAYTIVEANDYNTGIAKLREALDATKPGPRWYIDKNVWLRDRFMGEGDGTTAIPLRPLTESQRAAVLDALNALEAKP